MFVIIMRKKSILLVHTYVFCILTNIKGRLYAIQIMNRLVNLLMNRLVKDDKKVLGRWSIEYCDKKMNNRVDLSNEDHCGPCGQYTLDKTATPAVPQTLNKLPIALVRGSGQTNA
jgi:hypothetical protein